MYFQHEILNFVSPWRHGVLGRDSIAVNRHHGNLYEEKNYLEIVYNFNPLPS